MRADRSVDRLPRALERAITSEIGPIRSVTPTDRGTASPIAVRLYTECGLYFCKAIPADDPRARMHRNEAVINPLLPAPVPRLCWTVARFGWLALGFEFVAGRHADFTPGSFDVDSAVAVLAELQKKLTPAPAGPVRTFGQRWHGRIHPATVAGDTLLHTDLSRRNFLVRDGTAHLVDWALPAVGAGWIDPAFLAIRLIRYGHTPAEAERRVAGLPSWRLVDPADLAAWLSALIGLWSDKQRVSPARHRVALLAAARSWASYRSR